MVIKNLFILLFSLLFPVFTFAQWRVVTDPKCLLQVTSNMASQKVIENQHNNLLDSIQSKQETLMTYTSTMATIKEVYKLTLENIAGFGPESKYYTEIGLCAYDIVKDVPELIEVIYKAKFTNKLLCLNELSNISLQTQQLVADFVNIVNNGKVDNPLKKDATAKTVSDGFNLLNRYDRLSVANRIYTDLLNLRYKIQGLILMAQYATRNDLLLAIDPDGWYNVMMINNSIDMIIVGWNNIK